jgi:hypothetical protein
MGDGYQNCVEVVDSCIRAYSTHAFIGAGIGKERAARSENA